MVVSSPARRAAGRPCQSRSLLMISFAVPSTAFVPVCVVQVAASSTIPPPSFSFGVFATTDHSFVIVSPM